MNHTRGPWFVCGSQIQSGTDMGQSVICNMPEPGLELDRANAHLIAATPELLSALISARNCLKSFQSDLQGYADGAINKAEQAIAKAEGQAYRRQHHD